VDMVRDGTVQAVVANLQVIQSRIAVDVAVKHLEGIAHPRDIQLPPEIIDRHNVGRFDRVKLFGPPGIWMVQQPLPN
ncbi:MAG: hypothetical protein JO142_03170, partial [Burkholderiales bacterium]|nr:hypothetical protein [Burkholderiales bacterium]